jgi:hypothetical protein
MLHALGDDRARRSRRSRIDACANDISGSHSGDGRLTTADPDSPDGGRETSDAERQTAAAARGARERDPDRRLRMVRLIPGRCIERDCAGSGRDAVGGAARGRSSLAISRGRRARSASRRARSATTAVPSTSSIRIRPTTIPRNADARLRARLRTFDPDGSTHRASSSRAGLDREQHGRN